MMFSFLGLTWKFLVFFLLMCDFLAFYLLELVSGLKGTDRFGTCHRSYKSIKTAEGAFAKIRSNCVQLTSATV